MLSTSYQQRENSSNSLKKLKVLTLEVNTSSNQFLNLLWNSVSAHGVEVAKLSWYTSVFHQVLEPKQGDIVHIHWVHKFCNLKAGNNLELWRTFISSLLKLGLLKVHGYQLVWTVHNTISHECRTPYLEMQFRRLLSHLCDDIIVMSEYSFREFVQSYNRKHRVHIIPHGNYVGAYPNQISFADARQRLKIKPHQKVILHLGRVMRYKGVDKLLTEFEHLQDPNAILLIAGSCKDDVLREEIQQAAQKNSRILLRLEFIPDEDIQIYMNACDWVVLPYNRILNSGSALLALSFGRPIISPQKGAITELIEDGSQGLIYESDVELEVTLKKALRVSSEHWKKMCEDAYNLAEQYDWNTIGKKLFHIYQQGTANK